jgi:hypothetical protein
MPLSLSALRQIHSSKTGLQSDRFKFVFNERFIRDSDDPKDLGLKKNSIINVFPVIDLKNTKIISKKIFRP